MVRKKYTEEQIIAILKEAEAGQSYLTFDVSMG